MPFGPEGRNQSIAWLCAWVDEISSGFSIIWPVTGTEQVEEKGIL